MGITTEELMALKPRPARTVIAQRMKDWENIANKAAAAEPTKESQRKPREEESDEEFEEELNEVERERWQYFLGSRLSRQGFAERVLERLASIQSRLDAFDRSREPGELMEAIREAMWGWDDVHTLTMWIHEAEIFEIPHRRLEGASKGGKKRAENTKLRDSEMREEYDRRVKSLPGGSKKSKTALMAEIGKEHGLKRRQSIEVIRKKK